MDTVKFKCSISTSDESTKPLTVSFLLNNNTVVDSVEISKPTQIEFDVPDEEDAEHSVKIIVSGKTQEHTTIDNDGNILSDTSLTFSDFSVDDIDIDSILLDNPWPYTHDFNGHGEETVNEFYDVVGCNGTIEFKFTTPFYLWLLENM